MALADLLIKVGANVEEYMTAMDAVVSKASDAMDRIEDRFSSLSNVGEALAKVGAGLTAAVTLPIVGIGSAALKAAADMEQAKIGFTTLLRSGDAATSMLEKLRDFAAKTPFNFPELVTGAQRLLAMGTSAQDLIPKMTAIGNATAAMGRGIETFDGIALALSQMGNSAKATAQDMNQLIQRGIDPYKFLAESSGKSVAEIRKNLGELFTGAEASQIILAGMTKQFAGAMDAQSKSLTGMWSNVQDSVKFTLADIGSTLLPTAKMFVDNFVSPMLEGVKSIAHWFAELPEPVKMGALAMAGLAAAVGPVLLVIGALGMALPAIAAGLTAIGALGGVITGFGGVLAGLMGTLYAFASTAVPAAITALATFTMTTLPGAIAAVGRFATVLLVDAVGSLATFATASIPAAVAAMGTFITVTIPAAIAAVLAFATTAIPAAIAGLTTMAATAIPAAISAFSALASGGIAAATASIASMATAAIPILLGSLSVLGVAALAAGAAFVGWKIGEYALSHVPGLQRLNAAIGDMLVSVPLLGNALMRLYGIQAITDTGTKVLADSTEKLRQYLASKGITVDKGSLSLEEYNKKLILAAKGMGQMGDASALAKKAAEEYAAAQKKANNELTLAEKVLTETKKLYAQGAASQQDVANALKKVQEAAAKAHPELTQTGVTTAQASAAMRAYNKDLKENEFHALTFTHAQQQAAIRVYENSVALDKAEREMGLLNQQITKGEGPLQDWTRALSDTRVEIDRLTPDMITFGRVMEAMYADTAKAADALGDAFKRQRITSSTELKATADQAKRDLETIQNAHGTTRGEVDAAWRAMMEAEIAYRKSLGDDVAPLEAELAKYDNAHKNLQKRVKDTWQIINEDINRSVDDFGRNLSDLGRDLLSGDFSLSKVGDAFKQLGLDIAQTFLDVGARAITTFIKEHIGALLGAIGSVIDKIPGIGSALGSLSGAGTAGIGAIDRTIATVGGGATSAAGSIGGGGVGAAAGVAKSGITGVIGAVAGVASAISSIVGNFQMAKMETSLNAIEENTRYSKAYDLLNVTLGLSYWPQIENIRDFLWGTLIPAVAETITEIQHMGDWLKGMTDILSDLRNLAIDLRTYATGTFEIIRDEIVTRLAGTNQTGESALAPILDTAALTVDTAALGSVFATAIDRLGETLSKADVKPANITLAPTIDASGQLSTMNNTLSGISMMMARGLGLTAPKGGEFEFISPTIVAAIGRAENALVNAVASATRYLADIAAVTVQSPAAVGVGGVIINLDLRGSTLNGNDMVDRLANEIFDRVRRVVR